jgi:hypothetical protein
VCSDDRARIEKSRSTDGKPPLEADRDTEVMTQAKRERATAAMFAVALVSACGGKTLDLGRDEAPPSGSRRPYYATRADLAREPAAGSGVPTEMATYQAGTRLFALDENRIYWTTFGPSGDPAPDSPYNGQTRLRSCAKDDCAGTLVNYVTYPSVGEQVGYIEAIASNGRHIVWVRTGGSCTPGCLLSCPVAGCGAGPTRTDNVDVLKMGVDASHVYWLSGDATLLRCPTEGCAGKLPELIARLERPLPADSPGVTFLVDPTGVVWPRSVGALDRTGNIVEFEKSDAKGMRPVAESVIGPESIAADEVNAYWTEGGWGGVKTCPRTGCGTSHRILVEQFGFQSLLAVRDGSAYWFTSPTLWWKNNRSTSPADLVEHPTNGVTSSPKPIAPGQMAPTAIAVDSTHVYWRTCLEPMTVGPWACLDGSIRRIKR